MNPERGGGAGRTLLDQLIEGEKIPHPAEPCLAGRRVRHTDVGGFACQMLRGGLAAHSPIQGGTAVARTEPDGAAHMFPQRLQNFQAQVLQIIENGSIRESGFGFIRRCSGQSIICLGSEWDAVVDAPGKGGGGVFELRQGEMR